MWNLLTLIRAESRRRKEQKEGKEPIHLLSFYVFGVRSS